MSQVQPGDRVLHWWTGGAAPGLVGWSEVQEHATVIPEYTWAPRHGEERTTLGWRAVLGPFHAFASPVTSVQLLPILEQIVAVDEALGAQHKGAIYFPITRYGANRPASRQEVRAAEAYFVKFPIELFGVLPGIGSARIDAPLDPVDTDLPEDFHPPGKKAPAGRTTRAQDPKLRDAVERRSLDVAQAYYVKLGGTDYEEVGKPYDIRVTVQGVTRRCEVKGSSMEIDTVELTTNEVEHGTAFTPIDLIVVDNIAPTTDPVTGEVTGATGGRRRVWVDWTPVQADLRATKYAYTLPVGAIS
ncbi:MAG: protein NO VEIN domain-containing protein [Streptosporangiaceae bacterium]